MPDSKKVIQSFVKDVQEVFGKALFQIILYGSYARGDYKDNSDIDIIISINIKNVDHFNYWLGALPYYDNIKREGIILAG